MNANQVGQEMCRSTRVNKVQTGKKNRYTIEGHYALFYISKTSWENSAPTIFLSIKKLIAGQVYIEINQRIQEQFFILIQMKIKLNES